MTLGEIFYKEIGPVLPRIQDRPYNIRERDGKRCDLDIRTGYNSMAKKVNKKLTLLQKSNLTRAEYRKRLNALKRSEMISKKINPKTHEPTRYMLKKLRVYQDVALGHANAKRVDKINGKIAAEYVKKGIAELRGNFFVVPKSSPKEKLVIDQGYLTTLKPMEMGEQRIVILPYTLRDLNELVDLLLDKDSKINQLKSPLDYFGFQLYGHNIIVGQPSAKELAKYIMTHYQHLLGTNTRKDTMTDFNFVMYRFKTRDRQLRAEPYKGEQIIHVKRKRKKETNWERERRRKRQRNKKAQYRKSRSPEQIALDRQRDLERYYRGKGKGKKK